MQVVSTNAVLLHFQLLPSSELDTGIGAVSLRKATQASVKVAITNARLLPVHRVRSRRSCWIARRIGAGEPFICDRNHNFQSVFLGLACKTSTPNDVAISGVGGARAPNVSPGCQMIFDVVRALASRERK